MVVAIIWRLLKTATIICIIRQLYNRHNYLSKLVFSRVSFPPRNFEIIPKIYSLKPFKFAFSLKPFLLLSATNRLLLAALLLLSATSTIFSMQLTVPLTIFSLVLTVFSPPLSAFSLHIHHLLFATHLLFALNRLLPLISILRVVVGFILLFVFDYNI